MRILMWDVHGGYTDSLVAGTHDARSAALERYGLPRSLHDWDLAFKEASEFAVHVP